MLKMFSTQLSGLFKQLQEMEEFSMEDSARLLAQATFGQGTIYLYGVAEMEGVVHEALHSAEPLNNAVRWDSEKQIEHVSDIDRFLIITRYSNDKKAMDLAKQLSTHGIPFVAISTLVHTDEESLDKLSDVHIDLRLTKGLLPSENGSRFGYPALIAALFIYYGIRFTLDEILNEYGE